MPALSKFVNNATIKLPLENLHKTKYYGCVLFEKNNHKFCQQLQNKTTFFNVYVYT